MEPGKPPPGKGALRIDILGFDERGRNALEMVFARPGTPPSGFSRGPEAEVCFVDLDRPGMQQEWEAYREKWPERPTLVFSLREQEVPADSLFLNKPIVLDHLVAALKAVQRYVVGDKDAFAALRRKDQEKRRAAPLTSRIGQTEGPVRTRVGTAEGTARSQEARVPQAPAAAPAAVPKAAPQGKTAAKAAPSLVVRIPTIMPPAAPPLAPAPPQGHGEEKTILIPGSAQVDREADGEMTDQTLPERLTPERSITLKGGSTRAEDLESTAPLEPSEAGRQLRKREVLGTESPDMEALCGSMDDVDLDDPQACQRIRLVGVEGYLLGRLMAAARECVEKKRSILVTIPRHGQILLTHADLRAFVTMPEEALFGICPKPLTQGPVEIRACPPEEEGQLRVGMPALGPGGMEGLLWHVALKTYQGRLPAELDLSQRYIRRHWPNLTRLPLTPYAVQIAALWGEQPMTVPFIIDALKLPQRYVFAFFGAAQAANLLVQARRQADTLLEEALPPPPPPPRPSHSFYSRLLGHLRKTLPV
jgi:hypothetical protein